MTDPWESLRSSFEGVMLGGVPGARWAIFLAVTVGLFLTTWVVVAIVRRRLRGRAERTALDAYLQPMLESTGTLGLLAIVVFVVLELEFVPLRPPEEDEPVAVERTVRTLALLGLVIQAGRWGTALINVGLRQGFRLAQVRETAAETAFGVVRWFALMALWAAVAIMILSAFGVEITPLLAGLGVGGIAIAFALQKILGDIFCSVAIVLDRPFEVGDFIIIGDYLGTVEHIGIKTTRVRSLGGEQIVFPNSDLLDSRVRNYKRMAERRVVFGFGVTYDTPSEALERIASLAREIIEGTEQTRFDRAHFVAFGDSSLNFEVVYHVLSPDYTLYMDIQQRINLALVRGLDELGVRFAFPTRTVHLRPGGLAESPGGVSTRDRARESNAGA